MELLAPAGGFDQLRTAINFGADAVYLAAERFGMRARAANFPMEDLPMAVKLAHDAGVAVYVTCNVMITEGDLDALPSYLEQVDASGADALIIGDLGAFALAKRYAPSCKLHVSTQASVANSEAAKMWHDLGATRIVCAREMTLAQIAEMHAQIPKDLQIEAFVHGAQCMAVSSRCLISAYLTDRSGNKGACTQPCRWNYTLEEEKRPGTHFPIEEDNGTFIMNAKDLCMIEHLAELEDAGVYSIKIEGRNKKAFYVATVVGAYRQALDAIDATDTLNAMNAMDVDSEFIAEMRRELDSVSHRPYGEGFYFGDPQQASDYDGYEQEAIHVADVVDCRDEGNMFVLELRCRNHFEEGEMLEVLSPKTPSRELPIRDLNWVPEGGAPVKVDVANRAVETYTVRAPWAVPAGSFLRKREHRRTARHV